MTLRADPAHLPRLAGGSPIVLVAEGVMDPSPLASPALEVWLASSRGDAILLHPAGTRAPEPATSVSLATPPMGTIALIATERLRIAPIARWWTESSGLAAPPFLPAATGQAALAGLLPILAKALSSAHAREASLGRALVAAREELEETRQAMAAASRVMAHRPPKPPRLVLSGEAGDGPVLQGAGRHVLGIGLARLAAIAVHVAGAGQGEGQLHLRLRGGESERVVGFWTVPASALAQGWLVLDLPTPLGALRETAVLEVIPEGPGLPGLSRDARWAGAAGDHPLALRAWAGEPGDRYLAPAFWTPGEVGLAPPRALPFALPAMTWEAARPLAGQVDLVALGTEAPRPLLRARPGEQAVLLLPRLDTAGLHRLRIAFAEPTGHGSSVSAWLHPADRPPADAAALERGGDGTATTGWHRLPDDGGEFNLSLAVSRGAAASLAIGLRAGSEDAVVEITQIAVSADQVDEAPLPRAEASPPLVTRADPATPLAAPLPVPASNLDVASPVAAGIVTREDSAVPLTPPRPAMAASPTEHPAPPTSPPRYSPPVLPLPPLPGSPLAAAIRPASPAQAMPVPSPARPSTEPPKPLAPIPRVAPRPARPSARYEIVRLHQHLPGESYRHLDLTVASLAAGAARWAALRVKFATKDGEPRLEFRQAPGWPNMFRDWLGRASDKFGPFLRIAMPELRDFLASITDERDAAMMRALISVLPRIVEDGCRQAGLSVADTAGWVEKAELLQQETTRPAEGEPATPARGG
ncbi:DUF6212 domain-containing protein [Roseomonas xinghualingensis]|uniref:DUF6212 domain-containing protein n=1 Tax=Roseomonas xinghualingensis TaxID=2986475 RepID=UPI0021F1D66F|nr:DUF6212 domain-containing protein [Roseomonas sp. SXEYE001]MCV4209533.1 DUF6212 domain-containing protein [Roseomonas sp. SXEYE001]